MLTCGKCGADNDLGRIFCTSCGSKLDLSKMGSDAVSSMQKRSWAKAHWRKVAMVAVLALFVFPILAVWPQTAPLGEKGTRVGGRRIEGQLKVAKGLRNGQSLGGTFSEQDINGYYGFLDGKDFEAMSVSVDVGAKSFNVRVIRSFGKLNLGPVRLAPVMSYDIECVPAGGQIAVRAGAIGHLPLPRALCRFATRAVYNTVSADPNAKVFEHAGEVGLSKDAITVQFKK